MSDDLTLDRSGRPDSGHPDLVALLRGELSNAETLDVAEHLDECEACRADLADTAVGHALLSGAGRTLQPAQGSPDSTAPPTPLPPAPQPPGLLTRWARPLMLVAAATALVVGSAAVTSVVVRDDQEVPVAVQPQQADFEPVEGSGGGRVEMVDDDGAVSMTIETRDLPKTDQGEFYQVWLFNPETGKMLSLGILGPEGKGGFQFPDSLLGRYQVVDVSLEKDDGDPAHSVTSVLRATYAGSGDAGTAAG
jgi:Anti-sigma-K factor rskA, C-terminal/Putative zinc-finger